MIIMDKLITNTFPEVSVNGCFEIVSDSQFYVYDCPQTKQSRITLKKPNEQHFKALNINSKHIRFLSVDNCMFFGGDGKRCDFILYDEMTFCFIELKEVKKDDHQKRKKSKRIAEQQLLPVIELFQSKIDLSDKVLEAYLCIGYASTRPRILSKSQRAKKDFARLKTKLYDSCQKQFA